MIVIKKIHDLRVVINEYHAAGKRIGFVPTMGALHDGHISLVRRSKQENSICVCSIFINPTQFNNPVDLEKYPVTIEKDIDMLEAGGCDILFLPSVNEMYPPGEAKREYDLGSLGNILEGEFRPGHFQGVCMIVDKLLAAVTPDTLYLGRKDYQQCMVIQKMMHLREYDTALVLCDTLREENGLAMSSRNMRLSETEKGQALCIFRALSDIKKNINSTDIITLKEQAVVFLENNGFKVDYAEIADAETLEPLKSYDLKREAVALVAAYLNNVRLIDNIII